MATIDDEAKKKEFKLVVNKQQKEWDKEVITGTQIKELVGAPTDWVVNQKYPGPGNDPEIGADQQVNLDKKAEPEGEKHFTVRKPKTSPGQ